MGPRTRENSQPEFDHYSSAYAQLLEDPLRARFTSDPLHFHRRKWTLIENLLKTVGVDPGAQRWLDVGCGKGELLEICGGHFAEAMGCDPSNGMLASKSAFKVKQQSVPVNLPFDDDSVDFVTAVCVYHHVHGEARRLLTDEISRVLTPGGLCCMIEHNPWNPITRAIVKRCPVDADADLLSARLTHETLEASGFSILRTEYFLLLPEPLFKNFGAIERWLRNIPMGGQYAVLAQSPFKTCRKAC